MQQNSKFEIWPLDQMFIKLSWHVLKVCHFLIIIYIVSLFVKMLVYLERFLRGVNILIWSQWHKSPIHLISWSKWVQWLSARVLDSRPTCWGFEPYRRHCVVSLGKTHKSLLSTGSTQHKWKIVDWDVKNQIKQNIVKEALVIWILFSLSPWKS